MRIIVGLGNPGPKYENTRHNVGFMVVDALAKEFGLEWKFNKKFNSEIAQTPHTLLAKPQTFMNNSGEAVAKILKYFKLPLSPLYKRDISKPPLHKGGWEDFLTVIHDDLDLPVGSYKIKADSGAAGHNGVQSIIARLGTKKFRRVKIGVETQEGRFARKIPGEKFVLQKFKKEELEIVKKLLPEIIKTITKERL